MRKVRNLQPSSTNQRAVHRYTPLKWMPGELPIPNPDGGARALSPGKGRDERDVIYVYGYSSHTADRSRAYPTLTNGIEATATVLAVAGTERALPSIELVGLSLTPSRIVYESGSLRKRTKDEWALSPINSSALSLVKVTDIKAVVRDLSKVAVHVGVSGYEGFGVSEQRYKRSPDEANNATWAEQALWAMGQSHRYTDCLQETFKEWAHYSSNTGRTRVRRLRERGWILPGHPIAGPRLLSYRSVHPDHRERALEEANGKT